MAVLRNINLALTLASRLCRMDHRAWAGDPLSGVECEDWPEAEVRETGEMGLR